MATRRANHPGSEHGSLKGARETNKKYVRIRGESEILSIRDESHWKRMLPYRRMLVCPDEGCGKSLKITERRDPRLTRYVSDGEKGGCSHLLTGGGGAPMTDEHAWLQGRLRQICERLGYHARLEADFGSARVDLLVESNPPYAIEVQRGSTDFVGRVKRRMEQGMRTVWILPALNKPKDTTDPHLHPLFSGPCVRLGYYSSPEDFAWQVNPSHLEQEVWNGAGGYVDLRVGATVGTLAADGLTFHPHADECGDVSLPCALLATRMVA